MNHQINSIAKMENKPCFNLTGKLEYMPGKKQSFDCGENDSEKILSLLLLPSFKLKGKVEYMTGKKLDFEYEKISESEILFVLSRPSIEQLDMMSEEEHDAFKRAYQIFHELLGEPIMFPIEKQQKKDLEKERS